jgi:hypothetical protein
MRTSKKVARVSITDNVTLRRCERVQRSIGDATLAKTVYRLLDDRLGQLGVPATTVLPSVTGPEDGAEGSLPQEQP